MKKEKAASLVSCSSLIPPPSALSFEPVAQRNESATVRMSRSLVQIQPGSFTDTRRRSPTGRGVRLKSEKVRVRLSPSASAFMRRWRKRQTRQSQTLVHAGSSPALRTFFGRCGGTGRHTCPRRMRSVQRLLAGSTPAIGITRESGANRQTREAQTFVP